MKHKKVLIIEDLVATQTQLSQYYDKQNIQYELCKNFLSAYEKITEIIKENKLWEYEYILMDGELNGGYTDKFIEQLLQEESVPPIISISWITKHSETYNLPYADKFGIIENLEFILWKSDETFLDSHIWVMEWYKNYFNNREKNINTRKELWNALHTTTENDVNIKDTVTNNVKDKKISFFQNLTQIFSRKQN